MKMIHGLNTANAHGLRCYCLPLLLLVLLLSAGCARKERAPAVTQSAGTGREIRAAVTIPTPPAEARAAREEKPSAQTRPASGREQAETAPAASPSPAEPKTTAALTSSVARMLCSAGRNIAPDAQPEAGFNLHVPDGIGDGEAFPVEFGAAGAREVRFQWRGKTLTLSSPNPQTGTFQALLPVALDEKARAVPLVMTVRWADGKNERFQADLPVKKRTYPVQKLAVASKYVSPPPEFEEKIKRDRMEMRTAVSKVTPRQYWTLPLLRPVPGEITSLYGLRRVYNGVPKSPHKGLDFDAKAGDPIHAAEDGVVTLVSEHYYGGNTIVIDHGLGVLTVYLHLSGFNVNEGRQIKRGDIIGFIGDTGRVTGPHLHLSLYVMGESVNAAPCLGISGTGKSQY